MKHGFAFSANTSRLPAGQAALDHLGTDGNSATSRPIYPWSP